MREFCLLLGIGCLAALGLYAVNEARRADQHSESLEQLAREIAAVQAEELKGENVLNPPDDGRRYATILLTSDDWRTSAAERRMVAWFDSHRRLSTLKTTTHFFHLTPSHDLWRQRYAAKYQGTTPMLRVQAWDGAVLYEESGETLPAWSADGLADAIERTISTNGDRPHDDGQRPDKAPWFTLSPAIYPTMHFALGGFPYVLAAIAVLGFGLWHYLDD